jgi:hypothetical protein
MCRVKKALLGGPTGHSQNKGPSLALRFRNAPHPRALPIIKCEAKFIKNQTHVNHQAYKWEGSYAYSPLVGELLCLLRISGRALMPTPQ